MFIYCNAYNYRFLSLEAGTELATAGYGIASMSFSGSINVGSYKVAVVKDLAEGGFGKVSLVKDMMAGSEYGKEYALKILLCQTKEQVSLASRHCAYLFIRITKITML